MGNRLLRSAAVLFLGSILVIILNGCAGVGTALTTTTTNAAAPSVNISASSSAINAGQSVTLTWSSTNATSAQISNIGGVPTSGSLTVSPEQSTTYVITATGSGGTSTAQVVVTVNGPPTVAIAANPTTIDAGQSITLTVTATNASQVSVTDSLDSNVITLAAIGGSESVSPASTVTYTATATGTNNQTAQAIVTVTVTGTLQSIEHVIFMLQENRTFDTYFGMLNPYRKQNGFAVGDDGVEYDVDGIDDKLTKFTNKDDNGASFGLFKFTSTCIDRITPNWIESYEDVNRFDFTTTRPILMDGFVHSAENFAQINDLTGQRVMGYYDEQFLNYYYYMASQFALSDRWFSPVSSKSTPNRVATMSGGTTQGLVHDIGVDDHLGALNIRNIFQELDAAGVAWKIYYTVTNDQCLADGDGECSTSAPDKSPATTFADFTYATKYLSTQMPCTPPKIGSQQAVGDPANAFCIDPAHIAPLSQYFIDLSKGTLASYSFIEAGYSNNDEHPGSGQSILLGQAEVAKILNAFMASSSWGNSVFFFSYDEGGGPFDHVPPVPGHTNDNTDASLGVTTDISTIAVNPDSFFPCLTNGTVHCDLNPGDPGTNSADAAAVKGFAAQLGFRLPNMVVSPFSRRHFVSHTPMDHTAITKFVENRFIGPNAHLTPRDAAQPDLMEFFDFTNIPWKTPPSPPAPASPQSLGFDPCHAGSFAP